MVVILLLLRFFDWIPPVTYTSFFKDPVANLSQMIWPALVVGFRYAAVVSRMVRSSVVEVLREDYIRTARAKGVPEKRVVVRHAIRNALLPAVTVIGLEFAFLMGGLVVTEQVFNLNGIGQLFVQAVTNRDFLIVQNLVLLLAFLFIFINFVVACSTRSSTRASATVSAMALLPPQPRRRRRPAARCPQPRQALHVREPLGMAALVFIVVLLVAGIFAETVTPYDPVAMDFAAMFAPPSLEHPFGTDNYGRDILTRVVYGARTALVIGLASSFLGARWARCSASPRPIRRLGGPRRAADRRHPPVAPGRGAGAGRRRDARRTTQEGIDLN